MLHRTLNNRYPISQTTDTAIQNKRAVYINIVNLYGVILSIRLNNAESEQILVAE